MPGGERQNALETLKTLLTTRPVLYVGFGLRDPDFLYLRDLLLNIYHGAVRDHWAIMPDVGSEEVDYWRSQYGIRLVGYETRLQSDGSPDHGELLSVLELLAAPDVATSSGIDNSPDKLSEAEWTLALTRYTSGLIRRLTPTRTPIDVRISQVSTTRNTRVRFGQYEGWTTNQFLLEGPQPAYLIGLPGSGKSFALRQAARQLATDLQQACLEDTIADTRCTLPVLVDLKLYRGDLGAQIAAELPAGFSLDQLRGSLRLRLFLDAFNEMPSEHLESGELFKSLETLASEIGDFSYAISSRTTDSLLERPGEPSFYEIDRFQRQYVAEILTERGISLSGAFADEVEYLLSRPFFLHLVSKAAVEVPKNARPRDLFASYLTGLQAAFAVHFGTDFEIFSILSKVAYRAIETENEAFPIVWLTDLLTIQLPRSPAFNAVDVVNWLIGREFLISYTGRRASFVHQSITEYCAATELARLSRIDELSLHETIASKKWDQCLFLALALMQPDTAERVLIDAMNADVRLAINAVRYAEEGQSSTVTRLLDMLNNQAKSGTTERQFGISLRHLPVGPEHVTLLRELVGAGNTIGGEAVRLMADLLGAAFKPELLDLLEAHGDDYNFAANGIAPALTPLIEADDLPRVLEIAKRGLAKDEDGKAHFSAVQIVLSRFGPDALASAVRGTDREPRWVSLMAGALHERQDDDSFALLAELLLENPAEVTPSLALALTKSRMKSSTTLHRFLDHRHIEAIWSVRFTAALWSSALSRVCKLDPILKSTAAALIPASIGIEAIGLRYCTGVDHEILLDELEALLSLDDASLINEEFNVYPLSKLNWRGREPLLVRSIARDLPKLRSVLLEVLVYSNLVPASISLDVMQPALDMIDTQPSNDDWWWFRHRLGELAAHVGDKEVQDFCLNALLHGSTNLRDWVKKDYLSKADLNSDALNDDMIAVLLADLNLPNRIQAHWYNPLGHIATERLVRERLLPLAEGSSSEFRKNLSVVLSAAGDRHGKRYLVSTSQVGSSSTNPRTLA